MILIKLFFTIILVMLFMGIVLAAGFVSTIYRLLFGGKPSSNAHFKTYTRSYGDSAQQDTGRQRSDYDNMSASSSTPKRKIIPQDEGEYVDFEEIK